MTSLIFVKYLKRKTYANTLQGTTMKDVTAHKRRWYMTKLFTGLYAAFPESTHDGRLSIELKDESIIITRLLGIYQGNELVKPVIGPKELPNVYQRIVIQNGQFAQMFYRAEDQNVAVHPTVRATYYIESAGNPIYVYPSTSWNLNVVSMIPHAKDLSTEEAFETVRELLTSKTIKLSDKSPEQFHPPMELVEKVIKISNERLAKLNYYLGIKRQSDEISDEWRLNVVEIESLRGNPMGYNQHNKFWRDESQADLRNMVVVDYLWPEAVDGHTLYLILSALDKTIDTIINSRRGGIALL
jgi:hypothetical protein